MFDELYPEAADLALKTKINRPPTAPKAPEFSTWGMFRGLGTGLPAGAAQAMASTGEMLGAFGTTLATTGGSAGGMFQLPTEAEQKQSLEATDKLIKGDELFAGGEVTRSFRNAAEGYKPDPTTTHTAEQVVFNFARVGGKAITAAMTMGNVPGAIVAGAEEGFTQAEELKQQGVDIGTRTKVGAVTAVTNAVGFALPVAGKTWLQTAGLVAVGGPGTFVTQQAATKAILENANYADLAKQYDPTDTLGLAMSVLLPGAFGALAMRGAAKSVKAKGVPPDTAPVPDAPTAPKDYPDADLVDAARVSLVRQHMDAANPMPDNVETAGAHNAAYSQALDQVAAGERVAVTDVAPSIAPVAGKATDTPNFKAWFGDSKVVDDTGAPMVLYHGTGSNFDEISPSAGTANSDAGFYVSPSPSEAGKYAAFSEGSQNIVPVFASIKNPYFALTKSEISTGENGQMTVKDWGKLRAAGFDGVAIGITKDEFLSGARKLSDASELAVLNGRQIKSAIGNSGKFDPNSASLTDNPIADWGAGLNRALEDMAAAGERVAAKAAEEIGARIDAAKQADFVEVVAKPNSDFVQAKSDAGLVGGHVRDGALHITTAEVDPAYRGQGEGIKLYTALVDDALAKGQRVFSDSTVEASAVRMYEALQRRGYEVKRLEGGSLEDGAAYGKGAKEPAFEVVGKTEPKPKSDPPVYADTRGGPDRFHGTGKPIPALSDYYALAGDSRNIYGQGFYTTDAVDISAGYMRKGGKNSTLYKVTESDVKMYDMEAPITPEMEGILKSAMGDSYPTANYESGAPLKNLRDVYDEYRRQSRYEGLSRDDVQEVFDSIRANLEAQGYRGFSHVGGALTGKQAHAVKIFWFPESDVQIKPASIADYVQNKPQALADTAQAATKTVADQTPDLATFMTAKGLDAPAAPVEPKAANGNAFIAWLKDAGGVAWSQKTDIVGERGVRGNYAGIFTKKGQNLDTLVESAVQAGYLTRADLEASGDVGGTRALSELIRRATTGEKIATVENADASRIAQGQARAAMDAVDDMERELRALGVDPSAARGNADALGAYLAEHRTALVNKKLAEIDAETKAERIATGEAYNLSPKQIDAQTRIALAGELDENAMHQAAMVARDEVDFLNRVEEIINNAPGSRKTIQSSQGSAADASIPARDGQAAADATTSASGFNPAALAADAARFLEGGKSAAQVIGEMEVSGAKASPEMQNMLIGVAEFGGRINELADQVSALKAQRGAGTKPFELVAQAVENMRTGTKVEAPKPKTPTEARFADLQARNPDVMDKPMQFDVDENGNAAGPATTAREYLERIQREADQDTADASLIEVAANCFLSGGM